MYVRVITLRYQEGLQGFPEEALRRAISGREVLETREEPKIDKPSVRRSREQTMG